MTQKLKNLSLKLQPFQIKAPRRIQAIKITPMQPLRQIQPIPKQILTKLGIPQKVQQEVSQPFGLFSLFPSCSACSCKAMSKQTLNQLSRQPDIQKQKNSHLNDENKKQKFKAIFKQIKQRLNSQKDSDQFQKLYSDFGHANENQWSKAIKKQFQRCK